MATIDKLEYINNTKNLIKNALNTKFNSQIGDGDTFRSYAQKINDIYENWPKVSEENTNFTLNSTKEGKMKIELKGNTSQEGTPTPEAPQDIHVVSGDNTIEIYGKNLAYKNTMTTTSGGYLNTTTGSFAYIESGETYTLSLNIASDNTSTGYTVVRCYTSPTGGTNQGNATSFNRINGGGQIIRTFTSSYTGYLMFSGSGMLENSKVFTEIQLEKGSTATTYEGYKSASYSISLGDIELCKIGNYQDYFYKDNSKWYLHKEISKVVLNGSNYPLYGNGGSSNDYWEYNRAGMTGGIGTQDSVKTNYFNQTTNSRIVILSNGGLYFRFPKASGVDVSTNTLLNTWLSTHNTIIYFVLAIPTTIEITDSILIGQLEALKKAISYDKQTNINQTNNNLPFILNVSALKKNSSN